MVFSKDDTTTFSIINAKVSLTPNIDNKQDVLVSGSNIKTINGNSILGSGDIEITGGGTGTIDSVNGQTGVVTLDADDISDASTTNKFVTSEEKTNISNSTSHIANTSNPHSVTKSQIGLGNVDNTSDVTKMTVSTFSGLNTTNKTIVGAINETIVTDSEINGNIKIAGLS